MKLQTVALAGVAPQPWKNGGGVTRELLAWPSAADWRVRLSVADITVDGPFSRFEGVWRWFAVLQGEGVRLVVDGCPVDLRGSDPPFGFAGAVDTDCRLLGGPTRDFNLMLRGARGRLHRLNGMAQVDLLATNLIAAYAVSQRAEVRFGQQTWLLEPGGLCWGLAQAAATVELHGDDLLWARLALEDPR